MKTKILALSFLSIFAIFSTKAEALSYADDYNIIWNSQSKASSESMPCGGGDIGLNVWVENNELLFYIGKDATYDENNTLLKLGRMRFQFNPNPFTDNGYFKQELKLKEGYVEVSGRAEDLEANIKIWVEVNRSAVHVEINSNKEISVNAIYENWRNEPLLTTDRRRCFGLGKSPTDKRNYKGDIYTWEDNIEFRDNNILFYHLNIYQHKVG